MNENKFCFKKGDNKCDINIKSEKLIFIAMPFDKYHNLLFEYGIKKAIDSLKTPLYRADKNFENKDLFCKICEKIQQSELVIVDISDYNPNVMIELGMAIGFGKKIILLKEKDGKRTLKIISDLSGIEYYNYRSIDDFLNFQKETGFKSIIAKYIEQEEADDTEKMEYKTKKETEIKELFKAEINKSTFKKEGKFYTTAEFEGKVIGGFFDNCIKNENGELIKWNWDKKTIPNTGNTSQGILNGYISVKSTWSCDIKKFNPGKYNVFVRLYEHPLPGVKKRYKIKEKRIQIEIE